MGVSDVPSEPTPEQVRAAVELLVDDLLGDFPFDDDDDLGLEGRSKASQANAVAMIINQFARDLFRGPSPIFTIIKPSAGVGGTLLAEIPQRLFDGAPSSTLPFTHNDDEMQKLLVSIAVDDGNFAFFDNVTSFNSGAVKRITTSETISGRLLGTSRLVSRPNNVLWQVTGINPTLGSEISRRSAFIALNSRVANNRKRVYRHADFKGWMSENRTEIIGAILTLIRSWWVAGQKPGSTVLASFESWSKVIGGILEHAGIEGFLKNPRDEDDDEEGTEMKEFVVEWLAFFKNNDVDEKKAFDAFNDDGQGAFIAGYGPQRRGNFRQMVNGLKGKVFEIDGRSLIFERVAIGVWRLSDLGVEGEA